MIVCDRIMSSLRAGPNPAATSVSHLLSRKSSQRLSRANYLRSPGHRALTIRSAIETKETTKTFTAEGLRPPAKGKHFLHIDDWSKDELWQTLQTAQKVKAILNSGDDSYKPLAGKTLAMIFTKPSMRTRISFETVRV
jgi:ornithine carbamoyltransferase